MRTSIYLIRHGQTLANKEQRYQSWSDSPLTAYGAAQCAAVAQRLRHIPFTLLIASPCERARAMRAPLQGSHGAARVGEDARWSETHHGRWEGLTYREALVRFPDEARARFAAGASGKAVGGESLLDVHQRVRDAWVDLVGNAAGGRIAIVTHATPIQIVLCMIFGLSPDQHWHWRVDLGSVTCIDVYGGSAIIRMVNEVPLLSRAM